MQKNKTSQRACIQVALGTSNMMNILCAMFCAKIMCFRNGAEIILETLL